MKRDVAIVTILWVVLAVVGEALVLNVDVLPRLISDKGEIIASAFRTLLIYGVPVFAFVVAVLVYMVWRYRAGAGDVPPEDGPPLRGRGAVPLVWFGVTSALALLLIVYPGLTDLPKVLQDDRSPDLVVKVESQRWVWTISYPQYGVRTRNELVIPVGQTVRYELTSVDVLHGFWIPAFGITQEAVPGHTTTIQYRATETGAYETNEMLRVQCSELCGLAHSIMFLKVRVVTAAEFQTWIGQQKGQGQAGPTPLAAQ